MSNLGVTEKEELTKLLHDVRTNLVAWDEKGKSLSKSDLEDHLQKFSNANDSGEIPMSPLTLYVDIKSGVDSALSKFIFDKFEEHMPNYIPMRYVNCSIRSRAVFTMAVNSFLKHLIYTVFYKGVEKAVKLFEISTERKGKFKIKAILEGIKVNASEEIFEGIVLKPLSHLSESPSSVKQYINSPLFKGGAVIVIEAVIFPLFYKNLGEDISKYPFKIQIKGLNNKEFKIIDFLDFFWEGIWGELRYALSLAHNEAIHTPIVWSVPSSYEIFNSRYKSNITQITYIETPTSAREAVTMELCSIEKIKCKYRKITQNNELMKSLRIPIHRWIASKGNKHLEDQLIDLAIAFEAIYLTNKHHRARRSTLHCIINCLLKNGIAQTLASRASNHLREDMEKRKELFRKLKKFYVLRSTVVHGNNLKWEKKIKESAVSFVRGMQDLCRESIMKILDAGKFPDWNDLDKKQ